MSTIRPFLRAPALAALALLFSAPLPLFAGGGPFNTLVVVNTNSAASVELGGYYAAAHGIPGHHICSVGIDTNLATLSTNQFYSLLRDPVTNHIATNGLSGQIDFLVLCLQFPTRINNAQGLSASLFYGPRYAGTDGCYPPTSFTSNAYFRAERAFRSSDGWNSTNGFVAFHLIASNLPTAKLVADRGAAAQAAFPPSAIYLYTLGSKYRGVREELFANTQFSFSSLPGRPASCVIAPLYAYLTGKTNVMGYQDGYGTIPHPDVRTNNAWMPGAYADHLTSYGGLIANLTNVTFQSTVLDWMGIGATASFGTVQEPCAYLEKFPDPIMGFYYARGFSIGECYAMAVAAPYQGLFAGDPLAAPFAAPPVVSTPSNAPFQIVTGTVPVHVSASARTNGAPAASLDLYLDERLLTNLATLGPSPGNLLSVVVDGRTNSATVATNDSLFDAVSSLADSVNADTSQIVSARALGDRLQLVYKNFNHGGDNKPVSASVSTGAASVLTLGVGFAATNLVPSAYPARKKLWISEHTYYTGANAGDTVTCILTLTNGTVLTNTLVATNGETVTNLLLRLNSAINTNPVLMATNGVRFDLFANGTANIGEEGTLIARTPGPDGAGIWVDFSIDPDKPTSGLSTNGNFSGFLQDYPDDYRPRASILFHVRPSNGVLEAVASVATTNLSDGLHSLDFVARDGSAVAAQSRHTLPFLVCNSSPQLALLGTNGLAVADQEPPSLAKGTDFGPGAWLQPRTNVFSLLNNGTAPLAIAGWTTNGPGASSFQFSGIPSAIEAGGVSNFSVVFAPATAGVFEASLSFASDALVPQTNLLFAGTHGRYILSIASAHGIADPLPGTYTNWHGAVLTNSISVPAPGGGTQLVCSGWSMAGHDPANGFTTNFTMTLTNDASLAWLWTTNFWLDTEASANGSVDVADSWQSAGSTTQITATADAYHHFTNWSGSLSSTNNPLDLLMDAPKAVLAHFAENLAASNTPEWWLALHGWTNGFDAAATNDAEPDGFFTWQEYIADTDPTNSASYPRMAYIETWQTNAPILTWPFSTGRLYQIHYCDDLVIGLWTTQQLSLGIGEWTDTNPPPTTNRYYRVAPLLP